MNYSLIIFIVLQIIVLLLLNIDKLWTYFDYAKKDITAIAYVDAKGIKGSVYFMEDQIKGSRSKEITIKIDLTGLPKDKELGFHIHAAGDLSDGCTSACAHFNPFNTVHGGKDSKIRHVGDLGNIKTDKNGECHMIFKDHMIKLRGYKQNIIGRSIVIHEKKDDLGLGGDDESLKTGNAGKRIACAVIGYAKESCV